MSLETCVALVQGASSTAAQVAWASLHVVGHTGEASKSSGGRKSVSCHQSKMCQHHPGGQGNKRERALPSEGGTTRGTASADSEGKSRGPNPHCWCPHHLCSGTHCQHRPGALLLLIRKQKSPSSTHLAGNAYIRMERGFMCCSSTSL